MMMEPIKNVRMRKLITVLSSVEQDTKPTVLGPSVKLFANPEVSSVPIQI
jgi:hypothetical protein